MEFDFDTLFRGALVVIGLLAFIVARRRKSPASAVYTIQVGDLTHEVAYVVRGGQIHVTSDGRRASAPLTPTQDPARVAIDLAIAMHSGQG
jgi:hypothetical protein